ncbi:phosphoglycerate dehydrogenase [Gemmata sp.]|uniref:phosphoglycerate dehydrogenase n=1 Tax=Gemmata sp. TaxID=1914242 RepID=UPI003F70B2D2
MKRVLIAPGPLRDIEHAFAPTLRAAGLHFEYPVREGFAFGAILTEKELLAQVPGCAAVLAGGEPYTPSTLATLAAAGLKVIARAGVGYDAVNLEAATENGIAVCFAPGTNQEAVAEHAFAMILGMLREVRSQDIAIRAGKWPRKAVSFARTTTLGIVGLGRIGKAMATRANAFGMNVLAAEIAPDVGFCETHKVELVPFEELLARADVVTLHVPKTPLTRNMIRKETLALMKPSALVINTSRGGVVHEADLYDALKTNRIAGAGLDVFEKEPLAGSPLCDLDNVLLTAHTAGVDKKSREDMALVAAQGIAKLLSGEWPADWVVNPEVKDKFFAR